MSDMTAVYSKGDNSAAVPPPQKWKSKWISTRKEMTPPPKFQNKAYSWMKKETGHLNTR